MVYSHKVKHDIREAIRLCSAIDAVNGNPPFLQGC